MRAMPGMVTVSPADDVEAAAALRWAAAYEGPCYIRLGRDAGPRVFDETHAFAFGRAEVVREGSDVTLVSTGGQTGRTVEAAELLAADGISAHVLHVATLKPLDVDAIVAAAERTGRVITVEEGTIIGGLGGAVAETLSEHRPTRVEVKCAGEALFCPLKAPQSEQNSAEQAVGAGIGPFVQQQPFAYSSCLG
jgi:transketolase